MQTPHGHTPEVAGQEQASTDPRINIIEKLADTLVCPDFIRASRLPGQERSFTRNRKCPFAFVVIFIIQLYEKSLDRELKDYLSILFNRTLHLPTITKASFIRSRGRLDPEAFKALNRVAVEEYYQRIDYQRWNGFRLLAVDGSTLPLPEHYTVREEFGYVNYGRNANVPVCMSRVSTLYDVLNQVVLDVQMDSFSGNERSLAIRHFPYIKPATDLVIFDRGYPSYPLMYRMHQEGLEYLIRAKEDWWKVVKQMKREGLKEKIVTLELSERDSHLPGEYGTTDASFTCRLCEVKLPDGNIIILSTSILDKEKLPAEKMAELYHYRWRIEEAYKLLKSRMKVEAFSGKTSTAVKQDFYAKNFLATLVAILTHPTEEKLRQLNEERKQGHPQKVNRSNAVSFIRDMLPKLLLKEDIAAHLADLDARLMATTEPERLGRSNIRKKNQKKPSSMAYKS